MGTTVKGTVTWSDNEERVSGAVVRAVKTAPPEAASRLATTNPDGCFEFTDVETGIWKLVVLDENATPQAGHEFDFQKDVEVVSLDVRRYLGEHDERAGRWFFVALCLALGALVLLYVGLHLALPYQNAPISEVLLSQVQEAADKAIALPAGSTPADNLDFIETLDALKSTWTTIRTTQTALTGVDRELFTGRLADIDKAIVANDLQGVGTGLADLRSLVENPPSRGLFWTREPFRFLEVFFWGLAGILTALILSSGNFLRWRRFYREGIWQHVAQIVTIPLLALVFVLLLSQVTVSLTLANNTGLQINLSDPRLLAAVAFLIGVQPWDTWRFIRETAGQLTGRQTPAK